MCIRHRWASISGLIGLSITTFSFPTDALEPILKQQILSQVPAKGSLRSNQGTQSESLTRSVAADQPSTDRKQTRHSGKSDREQSRSSQKSAFEAFLDVILGRFPRQGSTQRTAGVGGVCVLAPGLLEADNKIFSDRPLFVWQGKVDRIEVKESFWGGRVLVSENIAPGQTFWQYSGPPLVRGQTYLWTLKQGDKVLPHKDFVVMSLEEHDQVLQQQTDKSNRSQLQFPGQRSADDFAENERWSDALTALMGQSDDKQHSIQNAIKSWSADICFGEPESELAGQPND